MQIHRDPDFRNIQIYSKRKHKKITGKLIQNQLKVDLRDSRKVFDYLNDKVNIFLL